MLLTTKPNQHGTNNLQTSVTFVYMGVCRFSKIWTENNAFSAWLKHVVNNKFEACCTLCNKTP